MSIPSSPGRSSVAAAHYIPTRPLTSLPSVILSPFSIADEPPHTAYDPSSPSPYFEDVGDAGGDPDTWETDGERTERPSTPRVPSSSRRVTPLTQQHKLNRWPLEYLKATGLDSGCVGVVLHRAGYRQEA